MVHDTINFQVHCTPNCGPTSGKMDIKTSHKAGMQILIRYVCVQIQYYIPKVELHSVLSNHYTGVFCQAFMKSDMDNE